MKNKNIIEKVKETWSGTETGPLFIKIPKKIAENLGIKFYRKDDIAYLLEIWIDKPTIIIMMHTKKNTEEIPYEDDSNIPADFNTIYNLPIESLPKKVQNFISKLI